MKFLALVFCLALSSVTLLAQDSVKTRVILVGDAGALIKGKAMVLDAVKSTIKMDEKTVVVFLGDNLYDAGLPDETYTSYSDAKAALDSQINFIKGTPARGYMVPGNHDWANGRPEGYENIVRQQLYVDQNGDNKLQFFPKGGCPGPIEVPISDDVVLVMLDSQWWIQENDKPGIESDCEFKTQDEVIGELEDILNRNYNKLVLLACHHPFKSNGPHGGYFTIKQHVFPFTDSRSNLFIPLPIIGSVYPIARSVFGTPQDLKHPNYTNMSNRIMTAVKTHPHVIMVAGHEHALQLLNDSSYNFVISGSGSKTTRVSPGRSAKFVARSNGFATLDILKNKSVRVNFFTLDVNHPDSVKQAYTENILDYSKLPAVAPDTAQKVAYVYKDFVKAAAGPHYAKTTGIQRLFNGNNYRKEWATPVNLKVFNINKEKGGFKIEGVGGGKQTKSLKLKDKNGKEWTLRTIEKDPEKAIPQNFRQSFASNVIQDMISASHPYAPLAIPTLADTTGVMVAPPEFFYVPDDPSLGYYRPMFANQVCMLERKDPADKEDSKSSFAMFNKMREDNDHTVDQEAVLRARLLDMLIADWDRHFDQWRWTTKDTGQGRLYIPIPRDRDQAFFYSDGLIVRFVSRKRMHFLAGLQPRMTNIKELNRVAKDFDRMFLNNLDESAWRGISAKFTENLPDSKIDQAIHMLPPEIYDIHGKTITEKLISRRKQLPGEALKYYRFLSKEVTVLGSNENEYFHFTRQNDSLQLTVYSYRKHTDTNFVMYRRVFDPKVTREVRVYGFNGNDKFTLDSGLNTSIMIRMIGGRGNDSFYVNSPMRTFVYDNTFDSNYLAGGRRTKKIFERDANVNEFSINSFNYPVRRLPQFYSGFNEDDGFLLGTGFRLINYGFRKVPYASSHNLVALFALTRKSYQISYNGELIHALGKTDVLLHGRIVDPVLNNFFGFGNVTKLDKSKHASYYRVRYREAAAEVLFRRKPASVVNLIFGPSIYQYWNRVSSNADYILSKPSEVGLDSTEVYKTKTYAGAKVSLELDNLNNPIFPTRGIRWANTFSMMQPLNKNGEMVNKLTSDMIVYASLKIPARIVGVIKMGGGHIFNDSIEYFQALSLGQNNQLRGFRKNRFSGHSLAYGSLELRIKILEGKSYALPGQVGLIAFNDIGRVWYRGESSKKWHYAYGGGIYYNPFNLVIVSATVGFSAEETVFNFSIGTKFNLTY